MATETFEIDGVIYQKTAHTVIPHDLVYITNKSRGLDDQETLHLLWGRCEGEFFLKTACGFRLFDQPLSRFTTKRYLFLRGPENPRLRVDCGRCRRAAFSFFCRLMHGQENKRQPRGRRPVTFDGRYKFATCDPCKVDWHVPIPDASRFRCGDCGGELRGGRTARRVRGMIGLDGRVVGDLGDPVPSAGTGSGTENP